MDIFIQKNMLANGDYLHLLLWRSLINVNNMHQARRLWLKARQRILTQLIKILIRS